MADRAPPASGLTLPRALTIYYGWYSNRTRGFRKAPGLLAPAPPSQPAPESDRAPLAIRRPWARLIRKIYEVDPLRCTRCGATMKVIAVLEDEEVTSRIRSHLKLLSPGDGPRAPPRSVRVGCAAPATPVSRALRYAPIHDLPAASAQAGDLPGPDPA
jgi:hypothetical protein